MTNLQIEEKAKQMIAKGCKLSFEAVCQLLTKQEAASSKKKFKAAIGTDGAAPNPNQWLAEKNRENAMRNLPSSLR